MRRTINLIMLKGKTLEIRKARWDDATNLAKTREHGKNHNYYVDPSHFFYKKSKIYVFIDVNKRTSMNETEIFGSSVKPELREELDAKLLNQLDYLTEKSFWEAMQSHRKDLALILLSMGCGIGLYSVMRAIASMFGFYLP